jgi:glycosidase
MTREEDGTWTALVRLPAGDHAYKLFVPGATQASDRWFEDPASPYHAWVGGVRNSRVRVRDCAVPLLELVDVPVVTGTGVSFQVRYVDGSAAAGLDAASARVTRNDEPVPGTIDVATGLFTVADTGLAKTRHTYRFHAQDRQGRVAAMLYVPVWVEDRPFSWRDATLYFALTDRFVDGDPTNNAPTPGVDPRANWHGGDLAGLLQTLEDGYFDRLSVNALWVSSVSQNTSRAGEGQNGDAHTYSGYHSYWPISTGWRPDNPLPGVVPVDPHFGDLALFKQVVRAAHARGIRVVMDLVANHVHEDSPLWAAHREGEASWFHAFFQCGFDEAPISCWFTPYLPDLDFTRLPALDAVVEHAVWLAQEGELDGFRLDAVKHMVHDLPRALRARLAESIQGTPERFFLVGETFTDESARGAATIREYVNAAELDGQFDFPLMWRVASTFLREDATFATLETKLQQWAGYYGPEAVMSTFLGNHDLARALSLAAGDVDGTLEQAWDRPPVSPASEVPYRRLRLAWTFLLTTPGVPLIYYGDEFGMPGAVDPDNRRPMRFNLSPGGQEQATLDHVTALSAARAAHPATRQGHRVMLHLGPDGLTWAYGMVDGQDRVVVAFNRRESAERVVVGLGALGFLDGDVLRDVVGGGQVTVAGGQVEVELPSRASAVLVAAP